MRRISALAVVILLGFAEFALAQPRVVSSLGRIEPAGGVLRLAGPSGLGSVIMDLRVEEGQHVKAGDLIATLDSFPVRKAELARHDAELQNALQQLQREKKLGRSMATSASKIEALELSVAAARAGRAAAAAMQELSLVKAPRDGQVLYVHARPGERVGVEGVIELGDTSVMYTVAEVYETDIIHVKKGQQATISSPALAAPVTGTVEKIGLKVGRMDVLGMDPIAEADARVVEVDILLQDTEEVRKLTHLQVEVEIGI
ncbi:efflux RND transporter periplasmic adaptor subunit [Halioglobus maricola]|nr:efflux RND transporter periplasmic adaptor subunit [Halioglobus maricola]